MTTASQQQTGVVKKSISNFLNLPQTQNFLEENLKERKAEFISNLIAITEADANLAACDHKKLMMCAFNATALNLPLNKNLGYAYVIPYKGEPSFQIGYKGYIQLALRTGMYKILNACEIREGELERNKVTGEIRYISEKPDNRVVGYLAYMRLNTGFEASVYMSEEQIEQHAYRFSKMYQADKRNKTAVSKWSDPEVRPKMALKTVLKSLLGTYGLLTTEMVKAWEADNEDSEYGNSFRNVEDAEVIPQPEPAAAPQSEPRKINL